MHIAQLDIGGRRIEYAFANPASAGAVDLVMLHEGLGSISMWRHFPQQLATATGCRTLVYSRFGYGGSTALTGPRAVDYMHEEARVWLPAILERLHIRRPILFGHSDGGSIALIHAARAESDVRGIVALAPHVRVEDLTVRSIEAAKVAYASIRSRLSRHHADVDAAFWAWNDIWLSPAFRNWNIEALLPSVRCPILAIQGEDDEYGSMEQIEIIGRVCHNSTMLRLADCRHSPHSDRPEAVLAASREFAAQLVQAVGAAQETR